MSIEITDQDGSSEKLLDVKRKEAKDFEEGDSEDESLATLLGISSKDVVSLDEDAPDTGDLDTVVCKFADDQDEVDGTAQRDTGSDVEAQESSEERTEVVTIEAENDTSNETEDKEVDFRKLFGSDLEQGTSNKGKHPTTSKYKQTMNDGDESDSDNNNESHVSLLIPTGTGNGMDTDPNRPKSAIIVDKKKQLHYKLLKKETSQMGKIVCGITLVILLICLTLGLLALGWYYSIVDLYIVGGIFGGGTVIFIVIFVFIRCTAGTSDAAYRTLYKVDNI